MSVDASMMVFIKDLNFVYTRRVSSSCFLVSIYGVILFVSFNLSFEYITKENTNICFRGCLTMFTFIPFLSLSLSQLLRTLDWSLTL